SQCQRKKSNIHQQGCREPQGREQQKCDRDTRNTVGKSYLGNALRQGPRRLRIFCYLASEEISIAEAADQGHQFHHGEQQSIDAEVLKAKQSCDNQEHTKPEQPPNHLSSSKPAGIDFNTTGGTGYSSAHAITALSETIPRV